MRLATAMWYGAVGGYFWYFVDIFENTNKHICQYIDKVYSNIDRRTSLFETGHPLNE